VIRAHEWFDEASSPRIPVSALNVLLQGHIDASVFHSSFGTVDVRWCMGAAETIVLTRPVVTS
jgi:hypothetical protein